MKEISVQRSSRVALDATEASRMWNWLLARQGLSDDNKSTSLAVIARSTLGLHAARLQTPFATVLARAASPSVALQLFTAEGRTELMTVRCMRKTLHALPPYLAEIAHAATVHFRERDVIRAIKNAGIDPNDVDRAIYDLATLLSGTGPLFHRTIEKQLISVTRTVAVIRLAIKRAWESGVVAYINHTSGWNKEDRRFALTSDVYPSLNMRMDRRKATSDLIANYFDRYGPASIRDAVWWSGLPRSAIVEGLRASDKALVEVMTPWTESPLYMFRDSLEAYYKNVRDEGEGLALNLLAHEDVALKAYFESRNRYLAGISAEAAFNQIGEVLPTVLLGGHVIGTWKWNRSKKSVEWTVQEEVPRATRDRIADKGRLLAEALRLGLARQSSSCNADLDFIHGPSNCITVS